MWQFFLPLGQVFQRKWGGSLGKQVIPLGKNRLYFTVRQQVLKWQKNAQRISRLPWERPHPELRNEPPLDMSGVRVQNPFMASLIQTWSRGWPLKGLGPALQTYQVGAHFEALDEGVLMAVLKSFEHFFAISNSAAALCKCRAHFEAQDGAFSWQFWNPLIMFCHFEILYRQYCYISLVLRY